MTVTVPQLAITRHRLEFTATRPLRLPRYAGSMWRGAFGHALKQLACLAPDHGRCQTCGLRHDCPYTYLFETPPAPRTGKLRKYPHAPHPYLLIPAATPEQLRPGDKTAVELRLIGRAGQQSALALQALRQAATRGLTRQRIPLQPGEIIPLPIDQRQPDAAPLAIPPPPQDQRLTLQLITPLRLRIDNRLVSQRNLQFHHLFSTLMRRISLLMAFHGEHQLDAPFADLTVKARNVRISQRQLQWREWTRYSNRQRRPIAMGGLLGQLHLHSPHLPDFWPYLWLGQWTHTGKGAVMGLGGYRIRQQPAPQST